MSFLDKLKKNKSNKKDVSHDPSKVKAAHKHDHEEEGAAKDHPVVSTAKDPSGLAAGVIVKPYVTEKTAISEANNVYTFVVNKNASKGAVKSAVSILYGVAVDSVRLVNVEGKATRFGRTMSRRSDWKKAYVKLKKGQNIHIHEGV